MRYTDRGMRRLARYLFTLCSAVSLLLCVATCALARRQMQLFLVPHFECSGVTMPGIPQGILQI